jgi:hypothetical protein
MSEMSASAPTWAKVATFVFPNSTTSGVWSLLASEVCSLATMPSHCCTSIVSVEPGCSFLNSDSSHFWPPGEMESCMNQTRMLPFSSLLEFEPDEDAQPASARVAASPIASDLARVEIFTYSSIGVANASAVDGARSRATSSSWARARTLVCQLMLQSVAEQALRSGLHLPESGLKHPRNGMTEGYERVITCRARCAKGCRLGREHHSAFRICSSTPMGVTMSA